MPKPILLFPEGLSKDQGDRLTRYAQAVHGVPPAILADIARAHLLRIKESGNRNAVVNIRLAEAMVDVMEQFIAQWNDLSGPIQKWLGAAVLYFALCNDDEPEFQCAIGFEDDVEILNTCLRFARLNHLCIDPSGELDGPT